MPEKEKYTGVTADVARRQEEFKRKTYAPVRPTWMGKYFWVFGVTPLGKTVVFGPHYDRSEAEKASVELDTYEIFELDTRDTTKATRCIKATLLSRSALGKRGGMAPDSALRRMMHKRE